MPLVDAVDEDDQIPNTAEEDLSGLDFGDDPDAEGDLDAGQAALDDLGDDNAASDEDDTTDDAADDAADDTADDAADDTVDDNTDDSETTDTTGAADAKDNDTAEDDEPSEGVDPSGKIKGIAIPKGRFDAMSGRARAAEENARREAERAAAAEKRLEELEANNPITNLDLGDSIKQALEAAQDPDSLDSATEMLTAAMTQAATAAAITANQQTMTAEDVKRLAHEANEEDAYASALNDVTRDFPFLDDPDHKLYRADVVNEMHVMMSGYVSAGYTRADALAQAVDRLVSNEYPEQYQKVHTPRTRKPSLNAAERRAATQRDKNEAAAQGTPPKIESNDTNKSGNQDARTIDINALSEEELGALPQSTLDELLGNNGA